MKSSETPPVLSTPASHIFEEELELPSGRQGQRLSDEQLFIIYEIQRTLEAIKNERYARVALQFPDNMLPDAPRVFETLSRGLDPASSISVRSNASAPDWDDTHGMNGLGNSYLQQKVRLYILADTSYGACCVDEIAAEHISADAVVHYGRACLSPTARIPILHVFTIQPLPNEDLLIDHFQHLYENKAQKIILMADVMYQHHLPKMKKTLQSLGFSNLHSAEVVHDPASSLPNRTVPDEAKLDPSNLKNWQLFHISDPPASLLLTLSSRLANIHIYPVSNNPPTSGPQKPFLASTTQALSRRYAVLTSVSTVSTFGILINTLSVKNYLPISEHVKSQILAAGKKSYTFVVGKVNAAKVANFSEVGAWVVIGCWESSLIDSKDFWKPVLTPFELELALKGDQERVWTGEWSSDFQQILDEPRDVSKRGRDDHSAPSDGVAKPSEQTTDMKHDESDNSFDFELESAPPEFDLRTGRYVSHSRPMQQQQQQQQEIPLPPASKTNNDNSNTLIKRAKGDLAIIGNKVSPGAEYLNSKRTWRGLGSDFEIAYDEEEGSGAVVEEGRRGVARGYVHGEGGART